MKTTNVYENLYTKMKTNFTIEKDNREYNLGEFMLMKAGIKAEGASLPAVRNTNSGDMVVTTFFKYVNDKLALKAAPAKEKTIRRFPFRTSIAAVLSALIACTLIFSYGAVALRGATNTVPSTVEVTETDDDMAETEYNEN